MKIEELIRPISVKDTHGNVYLVVGNVILAPGELLEVIRIDEENKLLMVKNAALK